jgi:HEPN domain-containing protein
MKRPDEVRRDLVRRWLSKANEDLEVAAQLLSQDPQHFASIGFHAQQAAEKYLKAFLARNAVEFPKTHDLEGLLDLMAGVNSTAAESLRHATTLTPYGVDYRYPSDYPDLTLTDARGAVDLAAQVKAVILQLLTGYLDAN